LIAGVDREGRSGGQGDVDRSGYYGRGIRWAVEGGGVYVFPEFAGGGWSLSASGYNEVTQLEYVQALSSALLLWLINL